MALEERAMLVRLSISQWYNRALDRKVAEEVATKYEVSSTDSQDLYIKTLLPKVAMRNVNRAISELRTFHYANTDIAMQFAPEIQHAKAGGWGDMMVCEGLKEMALWLMHESGYPEELQMMNLSLNDFRALK